MCRNNVRHALALLDTLIEESVTRVVFSSTVGRPRQQIVMVGMALKDVYVSGEVEFKWEDPDALDSILRFADLLL